MDPAFTSYALGDTWITNVDTTTHVSAADLRVGSVNGGATVSRTFLNFGDVRWRGMQIEHAELRMSNFYAVSCTASSVAATRITTGWAKADLTWDNQPDYTTDGQDYYAPAHGFTGCPAGQATWDVGPIVQAWANGEPQRGIRLAAVNENSANGYRRYRSTEYSPASTETPRLTVTYTEPPLDLSGPVVFAGTVDGTPNLKLWQIGVSIEPANAELEEMAVGDPLESYTLPETAVRTQSDKYAIVIDPASIPAGFVNPDGLVTFTINMTDPQTGEVALTTKTMIIAASGDTWTDPTPIEDPPAVADPDAELPADPAGTVPPDDSAVPAEEETMPTNGETPTTEELVDEDEAAEPNEPPVAAAMMVSEAGDQPPAVVNLDTSVNPGLCEAYCDTSAAQANFGDGEEVAAARIQGTGTKLAESKRWVTVTTSYPVGGDVAWLDYDSSTRETTGIAVNMGGGFRAEGSKTFTAGWGQTSSASSARRSYRVQVRYGKYQMVNPITGYHWVEWRPIRETGGTWWNKLSTPLPNWTKCAPVGTGNWYRQNSAGKAYSSSYGVKFKDLIGINLSSKRDYTSKSKLVYRISSGKKMCGKDADPAYASKLQEKHR